MEIVYTDEAVKDIVYWKKLGDVRVQKKIQILLEAMAEDPKSGIGKPELLKHGLSGLWSRRINKEHRIVYKITSDNTLEILSLRGHY